MDRSPPQARRTRSRKINDCSISPMNERQAAKNAYLTADGHIRVERVKLNEKQLTATYSKQVRAPSAVNREKINSLTEIEVSGSSSAKTSFYDPESQMNFQPNVVK